MDFFLFVLSAFGFRALTDTITIISIRIPPLGILHHIELKHIVLCFVILFCVFFIHWSDFNIYITTIKNLKEKNVFSCASSCLLTENLLVFGAYQFPHHSDHALFKFFQVVQLFLRVMIRLHY
jgi:hypothetical protein